MIPRFSHSVYSRTVIDKTLVDNSPLEFIIPAVIAPGIYGDYNR